MKPISLLELLHPDGHAKTALVIGEKFPGILCQPSWSEASALGQYAVPHAELIVLAPAFHSHARPAWIAEQLRRMAGQLMPDGIGYVITSPWQRLSLMRQIADAGLVFEGAFAHLPDTASSHILVPFAAAPLRFAVSQLLSLTGIKRWLLSQAAVIPGMPKLLAALWPYTGLVVRRPGGRPMCAWLDRQAHSTKVILSTGWRRQNGSAILFGFTHGARQPDILAKIPRAGHLASEEEALVKIGPSAQQAGAEVPQFMHSQPVNGHTALLQTIVPGRSAESILRNHPERLNWVLDQVVSWLERWHRDTAHPVQIDEALMQETLIQPAAYLAPYYKPGSYYLDWLTKQCKALIGQPVPLVAAHRDLTLANILLSPEGRIGIIDWETAQANSWPLADFFYFVTDAVMAAATPHDRLSAFKACFEEGGAYNEMVNRLQDRLASALSLEPAVIRISFQACWLHHAFNEHNDHAPTHARSFLQILQWLAQRQQENSD